MFWRFGGYNSISTIETVLDKPDLTLEDLLEEGDLVQEVKAQNAKLIDFLRSEDRLDRLLKYVVAPKPSEPVTPAPPVATPDDKEKRGSGSFFKSRSKSRDTNNIDLEEADKAEKQRMKLAYVACEVLSSEVHSIYDEILERQDSLRTMWDYVKTDSPLDPLQAGYFTKVNEALMEKKTEEMIAFIKTLDGVVENMTRHVDCPMIMDLLLKLISLEKDAEGQGIVDWLQSQDLIGHLLSYISPEHSAATQTSAGDFLKAIITISANATGQDASVIGPNELTRQLVSETCAGRLVTEMLKGGNPLTVGVGIVIEVIRKNNSDYDSETTAGQTPRSSDPIYLGTLLRIFANHIDDFMHLILSPKHSVATQAGGVELVDRKDLKVAWGTKIEPLGFDRFKTCELMAELLHCSNMGLLNEKGSEQAIKARDAERNRLKAEGKLASAVQPQGESQPEFGASVDSSGFQHAESFTPLGESPENIKRLEVQNSADEEEFEKVAMPEAMTDASSSSDDPSGLAQSTKDLDMSPSASSTTSFERQMTPTSDSSKRSISILSQQLGDSADRELRQATDSASSTSGEATPTSDIVPAPLFAGRSTQAEATTHQTDLPDADDGPDHPEADRMSSISQGPTLVDPTERPQTQGLPIVETEDDGSPVVGDLLKIKFVEHSVVPTILDFFFRFPWNNFLHNVVYDVVQQVFNGAMDRGYNCHLALDLFATGRITEQIVEGQQRSDKAQQETNMRLGYMGHLTLIAEEVVKFADRQPPQELSQALVERVSEPGWIYYVEHTLIETRDRDNAILGGVRPDVVGGPRQAVLNAVNAAQSGYGNVGSAALANAGLTNNGGTGLDSMDLANAGNTGYGNTLLSGFGGSDDEDDEEMGEVDAGDENQHTPRVDEDDQHALDTDGAHDAEPTTLSESTAPSMPAPLAIGNPSRARLTLQNRLAEKQRLATAHEQSGEAANDQDLSITGTADEDVPDTEEAIGAGLTRQTTREAAERRPLDDDSDDEDGEEEKESSQQQQQRNHNAARQREQEKLLQQWGLSEGGQHRSPPGYDEDEDDGNDDEDDDDDAGVEMGTKYLRNRTHRES